MDGVTVSEGFLLRDSSLSLLSAAGDIIISHEIRGLIRRNKTPPGSCNRSRIRGTQPLHYYGSWQFLLYPLQLQLPTLCFAFLSFPLVSPWRFLPCVVVSIVVLSSTTAIACFALRDQQRGAHRSLCCRLGTRLCCHWFLHSSSPFCLDRSPITRFHPSRGLLFL